MRSCGIGGVGKTALAQAIAGDYGDLFAFIGVRPHPMYSKRSLNCKGAKT
jgi:hypothetical protein